MKKTIVVTIALTTCFIVCLAAIADLSGKWKGWIKLPNGAQFQINYNFKLEGDKVTGTATTAEDVIPIKNGSVTGTDFTFTVPVNGAEVKNSGRYYADGDTIVMTIDFNGAQLHSTLKRDSK